MVSNFKSLRPHFYKVYAEIVTVCRSPIELSKTTKVRRECYQNRHMFQVYTLLCCFVQDISYKSEQTFLRQRNLLIRFQVTKNHNFQECYISKALFSTAYRNLYIDEIQRNKNYYKTQYLQDQLYHNRNGENSSL